MAFTKTITSWNGNSSLTGTAQLVTLHNRIGHSISYSSVLQLETSIAEKITISDNVLPPELLNVKNIVTHFCWDNSI